MSDYLKGKEWKNIALKPRKMVDNHTFRSYTWLSLMLFVLLLNPFKMITHIEKNIYLDPSNTAQSYKYSVSIHWKVLT